MAIKKEGNKFYTANKYEEALGLYSKAILLGKFPGIFYGNISAPHLAVLYSNRSLVLSKMNLLDDALRVTLNLISMLTF